MNILIIGGSGFVGSSLVNYLLSKNLKVFVYIHNSFGFLEGIEHNNLKYIKNFNELFFEKVEINTIYHAGSKLPSGVKTYEEFYKSNVELTLKIIDLAKKLNVKQFIYLSTGSIFSKLEKNTIFNEDITPNPSNYYGLTKYISEKLLSIEFEKTDIQVSIIRFPSIFGKNDSEGIVKLFHNKSINNENIELYSRGERYRNLIYIDSVVDILYKAYENVQKLSKYEIFMAGSSNSLKLIDVAKEIIKLTNSNSKIVLVDKFPPSDFDVIIDTTKVQKLLNFKPLKIEDGLKKYIEDMKNEKI
ncbi:NAD-dependent epimerase/dehydratase family protein [Aliarcobacter cryaerophilus]|uniref:NAD-dependent epimerase/dehydratase family protein n=1 Tax=Aliarcobacter cryaerophilus TaxID=28198 RepID=UPI003DA5DCB3